MKKHLLNFDNIFSILATTKHLPIESKYLLNKKMMVESS